MTCPTSCVSAYALHPGLVWHQINSSIDEWHMFETGSTVSTSVLLPGLQHGVTWLGTVRVA